VGQTDAAVANRSTVIGVHCVYIEWENEERAQTLASSAASTWNGHPYFHLRYHNADYLLHWVICLNILRFSDCFV
jgi:hypothetical protein